jgi:spermidine dehydrogenase
MDSRDRHLGMDRAISRRDFLNGVSVAIGASLLPAYVRSGEAAAAPAAYYPPAMTGMRGSHPGSFEVAHATLRGLSWKPEKTDEHYDLVIVGAGISGLSAAYIYHRDVNPKGRILILDNHEDFGGHAIRNEFTLDGRTYIGYGGTMFITAPETYPAVAKQVIRELGIDTSRQREFYETTQFGSRGRGRGTFFDKETFGADYLAVGRSGNCTPTKRTISPVCHRVSVAPYSSLTAGVITSKSSAVSVRKCSLLYSSGHTVCGR